MSNTDTHTFTITVPIDVELIVNGSGAASLTSVSPIDQLRGIGNIRRSTGGGWSVFFRCNDEHPLDGFSPQREQCIEMVEKHLRMIAWNIREGD